MARCVTHNITFDPQWEWCIYCGKPKTAELVTVKDTFTNSAKGKICADIIESNTVCGYCQRAVGAKVACSFSVQDFSCFRGRKLSPVA